MNGGLRGETFLEIRQKQHIEGWGVERMKQTKNASKKKGPREREIFMGCLGSISFSSCSFILAINIYLIKKHSPFPP